MGVRVGGCDMEQVHSGICELGQLYVQQGPQGPFEYKDVIFHYYRNSYSLQTSPLCYHYTGLPW